MKVSEQKKLIVDVLKPYFKKNKHVTGKNIWALHYQIRSTNEDTILDCGIDFFSNFDFPPKLTVSLVIKRIEQIIWEIEFPNYAGFDEFNIEDYPLPTLDDKSGFDEYLKQNFEGFSDPASYSKFGEVIINYLETEGKSFVEHYSYLPNILARMDELESEGKYWHEILAGGPDFLFRGLIISKMCNDPKLGKKLEFVDDMFRNVASEKWQPYYEKLKERLKTIEPIYNI